jgi:hypothetical protein
MRYVALGENVIVYLPSTSVDVAAFKTSPTCTTIDTPGNATVPLFA